MKFRYYITDTYEGKIVGTNNSKIATQYAESEDYFVVDAEAGEMLVASYNSFIEEIVVNRTEIEEGDRT